MATAELLPSYTAAERSRELRMQSYIMRYYAQRTRARSIEIWDKGRITRQCAILLLVFNPLLMQQESTTPRKVRSGTGEQLHAFGAELPRFPP